MYLERLQIKNYGVLQNLKIEFPFENECPKPVLFVGKNGSGKTLALSHIVNGMVLAKDSVYQESRELDNERVFKLRSNSYISNDAEYYCAQCDFQSEFYTREIRLKQPKYMYKQPPIGLKGYDFDVWEATFSNNDMDYFDSNFNDSSRLEELTNLVSANCLLYFPANRGEEPAWLNKDNLRAKPRYTETLHFNGETPRQVITYSPLQNIHDWLYDVVFDKMAFELNTFQMKQNIDENKSIALPLFLGYQGVATNIYESALAVLQAVMSTLVTKRKFRFGIGGRHDRRISLMSDNDQIVPNLFQLSSGEITLLTLFLSILRDFDLRESRNVTFNSTDDVSGLVVVDEVDLHLHSHHQYHILPNLIHMFPKVQFILTTHSPSFVLGMVNECGIEGFEVYNFPDGSRINPEQFSEIGQAFSALEKTNEFLSRVRTEAEKSLCPILFVEGDIDQDYLKCAANLLDKRNILEKYKVQVANGKGTLDKVWNNRKYISMTAKQIIVVLHDPESKFTDGYDKNIYKRKMPHFNENPIVKGIENLFNCETLEKAKEQNSKFFDITPKHPMIERGEEKQIKETWAVNKDEKRNLCDWLCKNGAKEDFLNFSDIFTTLKDCINHEPQID